LVFNRSNSNIINFKKYKVFLVLRLFGVAGGNISPKPSSADGGSLIPTAGEKKGKMGVRASQEPLL